MGSIVELEVDLPYTTQGHCPMEDTPLDRIALPVRGTLSANGKRIQLDETGRASVISDSHIAIDLQALRE